MSVPSMGLIYPPSYSLGTSGSFSRGEVAMAKDTIYFHLMPRLRMSGVVPLLPLSAFMTCMWTILPLPVHFTETSEVNHFPV